MLAIENLCVSIGGSRILRDVTLELPESKVFCLMGRNGVGKTTTLKTVVGLHKSTSGKIHLDGKDISRLPAEARARAGIGYVPQGRGVFPHLTVEENLFVGAVAQGKKPKRTAIPRGRSTSSFKAKARPSQEIKRFAGPEETALWCPTGPRTATAT